jgi:hypothetical protein
MCSPYGKLSNQYVVKHLLLPLFLNIRCFRFMKQMYLDIF